MPDNIKTIHDRFFKQLLADKEIAVSFLSEYLPEELSDLVNFDTLKYLNTSYLSKTLKSSFSDMVWQVQLASKQRLQVCLLLEHKSYIDPHVVFQILEYMALGYQQQIREKREPEPIIPILYYHGERSWYYKSLENYFSHFPKYLTQYLPLFELIFINLHQMPAAQIQNLRNGMLGSALLLQKYYFDTEALNQSISGILESLDPYLESSVVDTIFVYLIQNNRLSHRHFKESVAKLPAALNSKVMSIYDQLIQKGIQKGIEKGIEQGVEKGFRQGIEQSILNAFDHGFDIRSIRLITGEEEEKILATLARNRRTPRP